MKLGHVHLKVNHLEDAVNFYTDVLDLSVTQEHERYAFLSWGESHHVIALQEVKGENRSNRDRPGLYHVAFEVDSDDELERIASRVRDRDTPVSPVDHGISRSIYFSDPAGNGIEVYVDARDERNETNWNGRNQPLDV